ncbi:CYTH domain-containing protein [Gordonia sp. X0973]|uniref:CYTH domain-containing protein n=1 Tax=Gordonia sp. X0973 TaxID=2742602 RepID=UPI000F53D20A|nr:CYTH domain-containing protein [Gordonia sp. X0973]QKT06628.1 CYTH domain-containing protein [Gordonia sp. X0973]
MYDDADECETQTGLGDFEFERKFLLRDLPVEAAGDPTPTLIVQAYVFADDGFAVRVRISGPAGELDLDSAPSDLAQALTESDDAMGTLGVKGPANAGTRYEAERAIDPLVAGSIAARSSALIAKVRYSMWMGEDGWIVDRFLADNAPLLVGEVERARPVTDLAIPDFCVTEVSEDPRFGNEYLAHHPFPTWAAQFADEYRILGPGFMHTLGENRFGVE